MTAIDALRQIRAATSGLPVSHIPDDVADDLLAMGAIWQSNDGAYFASAETGDDPGEGVRG